MFGHSTVMLVAVPEVTVLKLVPDADAVFDTAWPRVAAGVGEVMCTLAVALGARVPKLQVSTPALMAQLLAGLDDATDQLRPALVGSVSVTVTPVALPAEVFVTVIV